MSRRNPDLAYLAIAVACLVAVAIMVKAAWGQTAQQPMVGTLLYGHGYTRAIARCAQPKWTCYGTFDPTTFEIHNDAAPVARYRWNEHTTGPVYGPETISVPDVQAVLDAGCGGIVALGLPAGYQVQQWDAWDLEYTACGATSCYDAWIVQCARQPAPVPSATPPPPPPVATPTPPAPQPSPSPVATATPCPPVQKCAPAKRVIPPVDCLRVVMALAGKDFPVLTWKEERRKAMQSCKDWMGSLGDAWTPVSTGEPAQCLEVTP